MQKDEVLRIRERFAEYGDVYDAPFLGEPLIVMRHPAHLYEVLIGQAHNFAKPSAGIAARALRRVLGDGLLTSNGALWKRQRRLIQPAFQPERLRRYAELVVEESMRARDGLADGAVVDVSGAMVALTLRIVCRSLFDVELGSDVARVGEAMEAFRASFSRLAAALPRWLPTPTELRTRRALRALDRVVYGLIAARAGAGSGDLLSSLMNAREHGLGMDEKQLRDELLTMLVAGHETTAHALSFTWHLLGQHPDVAERLYVEVADVLGGRPPRYEDVPRLVYTEQVLCEAMRLYPPAYVIPRVALEDAVIGGFHIPAGANVILRVFHTHHDPRWFPAPERFDPERFAAARRRSIPACGYLPFGAGARACIGKHFALMEATLILASFAQRVRFEPLPRHRLRTTMALTLAPKGPLPMRVRAP